MQIIMKRFMSILLLLTVLLSVCAACGQQASSTEDAVAEEYPANLATLASASIETTIGSEQELYDQSDYILLVTPVRDIKDEGNSLGLTATDDIAAAFLAQAGNDPFIYSQREVTIKQVLKGDYDADSIRVAEYVVYGHDEKSGEWREVYNLAECPAMVKGEEYLLYFSNATKKADGCYGCGLVDGFYSVTEHQTKVADPQWQTDLQNNKVSYRQTRAQIEHDAFTRYKDALNL